MIDPTARLSEALTGRYRIERQLGAGGMATVYLAHDVRHNRRVALKVLRPELAAVIGADRFLKEIETTANLQHPHILPLFDSGQVDGTVFYVMPFVEGESLRERLTREKQLSVADASRIATEVAGALDYAHRHGVIHRDIKPENILLHDGRALVADFGIALAASRSEGSTRLTETGMSLGTPHYMSPEQAMGDRDLDARTDVYALGCVTYEMLAGEPPFGGPTAQAIIARVMTEEPRALTAQRKAVPPHVEAAVLQALEKLPADRFATAAQFADALGAPGTTGIRTTFVRTPVGQWRHVALVSLAAALVMAAVAAWGWSRPRPTVPVVRYRVLLDSSFSSVGGWIQLNLSPDGAHLVHTGGSGGLLLVRRRDALDWKPIPGTSGAESPFFSPDSRQVAFLSNGMVKIANLSGGAVVELSDSLAGPQSATWTSDGEIFGLRWAGTPMHWGLTRVAALPGAVPRPLTMVDTAAGERSHHMPDALPRGRGVLFTVDYGAVALKPQAIAIADLSSGQHRVLFSGERARYSRSGHLVYSTTEGRLMAAPFDLGSLSVTGPSMVVTEGLRAFLTGPADFAVADDGTLTYAVGEIGDMRELIWVSRDGRVEPVDSTWHGRFEAPAISPDGTRVAVVVSRRTAADIFIKRLDRGPSVKFTFEGPYNGAPTWTPDGRSVTYNSGATLAGDLWTKREDGSARAELQLHYAREISEALWSSDRRWIVFRTTTPAAGAGDILAMRPGVDTVPTPLIATSIPEYTPTLSPDGRWLAYSSAESGRFEVYVVPFPDTRAAKWQVSTGGGLEPRWSRGGGEIFYRDGSMNLVTAEVTTRPTFAVGRSSSLFSTGQFITLAVSRRNYDVAPGDQRFLFVRAVGGGARKDHIVVVENWFEELRGGR